MPVTPSPAVLRACDVLAHLTRHPTETFTVSELSRQVGVPRATCDAVLLALGEHGFVTRDDDDLRYGLGSACMVLGDAARLSNSVLLAAGDEAEQLARRTSSCVALSVREGNEERVADVFDFGPPFGIRAQTGQSIPLTAPFGAVLAAWEDEAGVDQWLDQPNATLSATESARYRAALEAVRRRGYSVTVATDRRPELIEALETLTAEPDALAARHRRDELIREMVHGEYLPTDIDPDATIRLSQMSAPVFDRRGKAVLAIMLLGPNYDLIGSEIDALGQQLLDSAARATQRAGGHPPAGAHGITARMQAQR